MNRLHIFACAGIAVLTLGAGCDKKSDSPVVTNGPGESMPAPAAPAAPVNPSPGVYGRTTQPTTEPDNTGINKRDMAGKNTTPIDQSETAADIKTTADIRRAILADKSMSTNAQNCKIITEKTGMVTLRGVVDSEAEKSAVEAKAAAVAGADHVSNQLEVKSK